MKTYWAFAAGAGGSIFLAAALAAAASRLHAAGVVASVLAVMSLVYPSVCIGVSISARGFAPTLAALAGGFFGLVLFLLVMSPAALPKALASMLVISAAAAAFWALGALLAGVLGPRAGRATAGCILAGLVALPFWSAGVYVRGHWIAGRLLIAASPFLAAMLPWTDGGPWEFDPRTSPVLYDVWVGTDVPLMLPGWAAAFTLHAAFALAATAAISVWRRYKERIRS